MRILVAVACVAIISFVGYYFWTEYSAARMAAEREAAAEEARRELFELAGAEPGETAVVRTYCREIEDRVDSGDLRDNSFAQNVLNNCRALGLMR